MKKIKLFEQFVNERQGVPDAILPYLDPLADILIKATIELVHKGFDMLGHGDYKELVYEPETVDPKFPVNKVELGCTFEVQPAMDKKVFVNGGTGTLTKNGDGFACNIGLTVMLNASAKHLTSNDIRESIRETLEHELTHVYESVKRRQGKGDLMGSEGTSFAFTANMVSNLQLPNTISMLFHLIYVQAPHEISARVPQVQSLIRNVEDPMKRLEIIKKSVPWEEANDMIEFKAEKTYADIMKGAVAGAKANHMPASKEAVASLLDQFFAKLTKNFTTGNAMLLKGLGGEIEPEVMAAVRKQIESHSKDISKLERMNAMAFLKFWERKLNEAGTRLKHKLIKLTTY